jgi:hypothetical protein
MKNVKLVRATYRNLGAFVEDFDHALVFLPQLVPCVLTVIPQYAR